MSSLSSSSSSSSSSTADHKAPDSKTVDPLPASPTPTSPSEPVLSSLPPSDPAPAALSSPSLPPASSSSLSPAAAAAASNQKKRSLLQALLGFFSLRRRKAGDGKERPRSTSRGVEQQLMIAGGAGLGPATRSYEPLVFGVPLEQVMDNQRQRNVELPIPQMVRDIHISLIRHGLCQKGILRVTGAFGEMKKMKSAIDSGEGFDFFNCREAHNLGGLLLAWLRELPDPLMSCALYSTWLDVYRRVRDEPLPARLDALRDVLAQLAPLRRATLHEIIMLMTQVVLNHQVSLMSTKNLARVLSPNLLWPPANQSVLSTLATDLKAFSLESVEDQNSIVELMIDHACELFGPAFDPWHMPSNGHFRFVCKLGHPKSGVTALALLAKPAAALWCGDTRGRLYIWPLADLAANHIFWCHPSPPILTPEQLAERAESGAPAAAASSSSSSQPEVSYEPDPNANEPVVFVCQIDDQHLAVGRPSRLQIRQRGQAAADEGTVVASLPVAQLRCAATACDNGSLWIVAGAQLQHFRSPALSSPAQTLDVGGAACLAYLPLAGGAAELWLGHDDGFVSAVVDNAVAARWQAHGTAAVTHIAAISAALAVSAAADGSLALWSLPDRRQTASLSQGSAVTALAALPSLGFLSAGGPEVDYQVSVWQVVDGASRLGQLSVFHSNAVTGIVVRQLPDATALEVWTSSTDCSLCCWHLDLSALKPAANSSPLPSSSSSSSSQQPQQDQQDPSSSSTTHHSTTDSSSQSGSDSSSSSS